MKTKVESFDDIVFENRNQDYGAYELRKKYTKRGSIALAISIFLMIFTVGVPLIASIMEKNYQNSDVLLDDGGRTLTNLDYENTEIEPPPPTPPPPKEVARNMYRTMIIVDSLTKDEGDLPITEESFEMGNDEPGDTATQIKAKNIDIVVPDLEQIVEVFKVTEKPQFTDGYAGLMRYIVEHTKYPAAALENNIEGTIYIRFVVTRAGDVSNAKVLRTVDPILDEEALRVVESLPKWTPGKINGEPVNVWFIIPVKFVLQK